MVVLNILLHCEAVVTSPKAMSMAEKSRMTQSCSEETRVENPSKLILIPLPLRAQEDPWEAKRVLKGIVNERCMGKKKISYPWENDAIHPHKSKQRVHIQNNTQQSNWSVARRR